MAGQNATASILTKGCPLGGPLLTYCDAEQLTITRRKCGRGWAYAENGQRISDRAVIDRLNALAMPPAYRDVRFNPDPHGHLQAIGTDARGRRQYRYHAHFRETREAEKFAACADFGMTLPQLRKNLAAMLARSPTSREAVIAAMVRILDQAFLRIGNESYRKSNNSFGLTTLRSRHARLTGSRLELRYRGKSGVMRSVQLNDRALLRIVRKCQDLPGQNLFQYKDDGGEVRPVSSTDVNQFLKDNMGQVFTAKHFRTWHASAIAFEARHGGCNLQETLDRVSAALGNTKAIARKSYIHPMVLEADIGLLQSIRLPRETQWQSRAERGLLVLLTESERLAA